MDDILVWAETEEELMERTRIILNRCKEHNITISRKKLELGTELGFPGHIVSHNGIRPDDDKYKAIKEFPAKGWSNKPPPWARTIPSRFFKYRWVSLASKEGAITKKDTV